jgi:glycosyltransferase involved in cell wall biosynthesis
VSAANTTTSVAFDATPLLGNRTGIGVVVAGLITALAGHGDLRVVGYGMTGSRWRQLADHLPEGVGAGRGPMPASLLARVWRSSDRPPVEWWTGPVDVVHGTNYVVPPARRAARLVTVYDLTAVLYPHLCTPASLRYPGLIRRAVEGGASIHTLSRFVAEQIVEHFAVPAERVHVVYSGLAPPAEAKADGREFGADSEPPYILALGTVEPRKNFVDLVKAFDTIAGDQTEVHLKIAGAAGWGEAALTEAIHASPYRDRISRLGWVPDTDRLIGRASLFAFPSIYEGFGLPPLEAMALGVPVVASTGGALPEILGDAALLVDPLDPAALGAAIQQALSDDPTRRRLIDAGRRRAAMYSWDRAGDELAGLYRRLSADR